MTTPETEDSRTLRTLEVRIPIWERALEGVGRFLKEHGIAAFFAVVLLALFAMFGNRWLNAVDRRERAAEAARQKMDERMVSALEKLQATMADQAKTLSDQRVTLAVIESLMRVAAQADLRTGPMPVAEPPPKMIPGLPVQRGPAASPLPRRR